MKRASLPTATNGRHYTPHDRVAAYVAPRLGMTPGSVEQLIRGRAAVNDRAAEIIKAFRALGDNERLERFVRPIFDAYEQREAPPLCSATWMLAQEADASEDVAELRYQLEPTDQNLERLIQAKDREIARAVALRAALGFELTRRRSLA